MKRDMNDLDLHSKGMSFEKIALYAFSSIFPDAKHISVFQSGGVIEVSEDID